MLYHSKFPPNAKVDAHGGPGERRHTLLSGTWYVGWGKKFCEKKLIALRAGSSYTDRGNIPRFAAINGDGVVIAINGIGPSKPFCVDPGPRAE